jgi:hypothetical protein
MVHPLKSIDIVNLGYAKVGNLQDTSTIPCEEVKDVSGFQIAMAQVDLLTNIMVKGLESFGETKHLFQGPDKQFGRPLVSVLLLPEAFQVSTVSPRKYHELSVALGERAKTLRDMLITTQSSNVAEVLALVFKIVAKFKLFEGNRKIWRVILLKSEKRSKKHMY